MTLFHSHNYFDLSNINDVSDEAGVQGQNGSNQFSTTTTSSPTSSSTALTQTLYLQESGDAAKVSVNDLHQGASSATASSSPPSANWPSIRPAPFPT